MLRWVDVRLCKREDRKIVRVGETPFVVAVLAGEGNRAAFQHDSPPSEAQQQHAHTAPNHGVDVVEAPRLALHQISHAPNIEILRLEFRLAYAGDDAVFELPACWIQPLVARSAHKHSTMHVHKAVRR